MAGRRDAIYIYIYIFMCRGGSPFLCQFPYYEGGDDVEDHAGYGKRVVSKLPKLPAW